MPKYTRRIVVGNIHIRFAFVAVRDFRNRLPALHQWKLLSLRNLTFILENRFVDAVQIRFQSAAEMAAELQKELEKLRA